MDSFHVPIFRDKNVPDVEGFQKYVEEVSSSFCPYLKPSMRSGSMTYTVVTSNTEDPAVAEASVFAVSLALCELLRFNRGYSGMEGRSPLWCENVIFLFSNLDDTTGKQLLGWPHWVLKSRYTQIGVLFGKFWKGARETSKDGRDLPIPPVHFMSIRESIISKDPRFFEKAHWLRPAFETSNDLGQNVFADLAGSEVLEVVREFRGDPTKLSLGRVNATLVRSGFYERAKQISAQELETHKRSNTN